MISRREFVAIVAGGVGAASCMPPDDVIVTPEPVSPLEPEIRIGLERAASEAIFNGDAGLRLIDPDEGELIAAAPGERLILSPLINGVEGRIGSRRWSRQRLIVSAGVPEATVRFGQRDYRGMMEVTPAGSRLLVINRVGLEDYVAGVVVAEMGRRAPGEEAALGAQAVAARTYALRNRGRFAAEGFDLAADVSSQVYAGADSPDAGAARVAAAATRGEVLTWNGELIDSFYSSTCGGHTEMSEAVFSGGRPYLQAFPDLAGDGSAWCAGSPRFRWTETWTSAQLVAVLRRTMPAERLAAPAAGQLRDLVVLDRGPSGRVSSLGVVTTGTARVEGAAAIRRVLSPPAGGLLRSANFTVRVSRGAGRIEQVTLSGQGFGHGVGMCQWGAIGRARAGQDYRTILASYFPGTELVRSY